MQRLFRMLFAFIWAANVAAGYWTWEGATWFKPSFAALGPLWGTVFGSGINILTLYLSVIVDLCVTIAKYLGLHWR